MNPEKPSSGIHPISAPSKAPDAPPFSKPQENPLDNFVRRQRERKQGEARKPKGWRGLAANLWGNALVRFGLGGLVIGGGAYEAYQNVPAIHSTVDNLTGQGIPETFDNQADNIKVQTGINALPATDEQIQSIINTTLPPLEEGKLPTIRMLLPPLKPGETMEISRFYQNNARNALTDKLEHLELGRKMIYPTKGINIQIPIMEGVSSVELFKVKGSNPEDEIYPWFYSIKFQVNGQNNVFYVLNITADDQTHISPNDIIKDAPVLNSRDNPILAGIKGLELSVDELQNILTTNSDNVRITYLTSAFPPEYPRGLATKIEFITDPASGKGLYQ